MRGSRSLPRRLSRGVTAPEPPARRRRPPYARDGSTRPEIAYHTGLSRSTIAALVNDLQERGVVVERERPADVAAGARGRPAAFLALDPSVGAAIGLDFDHDRVRVAVADLSSTVLAEDEVVLDVDHEASRALDVAADLANRMLETAKIDRDRVIGVGAGLASPIDHTTGTVGSPTILPSWAGMRPAEELSKRLSLPSTSTTTPTSARARSSPSAPGGASATSST